MEVKVSTVVVRKVVSKEDKCTEYFVMLLPENEYLIIFDWFFKFFFVFFFWKVMF